MSVLTELDHKLPKVIDAKTHGIIDYCHAAFFLTLGFLCLRSNKRAATAGLVTGSFILVEALLTDYPLGVKPVIPFSNHGRMDAGFAASSWLLPRLFGFSDTGPARILEVNSVVEATAVALTDWNSAHARAERHSS